MAYRGIRTGKRESGALRGSSDSEPEATVRAAWRPLRSPLSPVEEHWFLALTEEPGDMQPGNPELLPQNAAVGCADLREPRAPAERQEHPGAFSEPSRSAWRGSSKRNTSVMSSLRENLANQERCAQTTGQETAGCHPDKPSP